MRAHGFQWITHKINTRHPGQLKKLKSWESLWSYQLNSTANPAHLPQNWAKLAKSAVLFSWWLQKGSQDFEAFNCNGSRLFILCETIETLNILAIGRVLKYSAQGPLGV